MPTLVGAFFISLLLHGVILLNWHPTIAAPSAKTGRHVRLIVWMQKTLVHSERVVASPKPSFASGRPRLSNAAGISDGSLTKPAQLISAIDQNFEWPDGIPKSGRLVLRLVIDTTGRAQGVEVMQSNFSRDVEEEIVRRFYAARYSPGEIGSRPAVSEMVIEVDLH